MLTNCKKRKNIKLFITKLIEIKDKIQIFHALANEIEIQLIQTIPFYVANDKTSS